MSEWPRDTYVDVETGAWGLRSNLRLLHQDELMLKDGDDEDVRALRMRLAGIDKGEPVPSRNVAPQRALRLARQVLAGRSCRCFLGDSAPWEGHNAACPEGQLDRALTEAGF